MKINKIIKELRGNLRHFSLEVKEVVPSKLEQSLKNKNIEKVLLILKKEKIEDSKND
jgi:hypothetical protein